MGIFLCHVDFHAVVFYHLNVGAPNKLEAPGAYDAGEDGPSDQDIRNFVAKWQWGLPKRLRVPLEKMSGKTPERPKDWILAKIS